MFTVVFTEDAAKLERNRFIDELVILRCWRCFELVEYCKNVFHRPEKEIFEHLRGSECKALECARLMAQTHMRFGKRPMSIPPDFRISERKE